MDVESWVPSRARMQQLTDIISERDHWQHEPLYLAILELVRAHGGAGASVFKGRPATVRQAGLSTRTQWWMLFRCCPY